MSDPSSHTDSAPLKGTVQRVTFHNADTGYCVLKVTPEGSEDLVTLIGSTPQVTPGQTVEAEGEWERDPDYGRQFKAETLALRQPSTRDALERYLASGLIEGVGPKFAQRIVERFGDRTLEVIEKESALLEQVEGVGAKKRREIRDSWLKQQSLHDVMLFLHQHGISSARALRIQKTYGDRAIEVLKQNPYQLASDLRGVGFRTADDIATRLGLESRDPKRLRAGLRHALEQAADSGHTGLPRAHLLEQGSKLLKAAEEDLSPVLDQMLEDRELEPVELEDETLLSLPPLRAAEQRIVSHLQRLIGSGDSGLKLDAKDIADGIDAAEREQKIELAESQKEAVTEAFRHPMMILTGGPGVGKTTLLRTILSIYQRHRQDLVLAAPTGRAARRLQESSGLPAKTLHRLLEYEGDQQWGRHADKPLKGNVFVIDETSMVDAPLMAQLLSAIPDDARLLLVGDADQLPSVGPGRVLQDLIESGKVPCVQLTEVFRQASTSRIITSAHALNRGEIPDLAPQRDGDFFFLEEDDPDTLRNTVVQLMKQRLPAKYDFDPMTDIQVLTPMNRNQLGSRVLNEALQAVLNPGSEISDELDRFGTTFRVGDRVIQTLNDYEKDVFNGDLGRITAIETDPLKIRVRFEGDRSVAYDPGELDALQLAYAMSIHKSQGSEFPCVILPLTTQHYVMLERSLVYTAITRARKLVILIGSRKALRIASERQQSRQRWTALPALLKAIL